MDAALGDYDRRVGLPSAKLRTLAFSGFLINVNETVWICTAGHIIEDLKRSLANGRKNVRCHVLDSPDPNDGLGASVPLPPECITNAIVFNRDGLDIAAIRLSQLIVENLKKGNRFPLDSTRLETSAMEPDGHVMLGFPKQAQHISQTLSSRRLNAQIDQLTPLLPVVTDVRPPDCLCTKHDRFFGRVILPDEFNWGDDVDIDDIDGMSGGPIFALHCSEERLDYRLVAVQSSWARESRIVAGTHAPPFFAALCEEITRIREKQEKAPAGGCLA